MRPLAILILACSAALPALADGHNRGANEGWNCRNYEMEISCNGGICEAAEAHTPMDIHLTDEEISLCAYTGCWVGETDAVIRSGRFETYVGDALPFTTSPGSKTDGSITVDVETGIATVIIADVYAQPLTCVPWSSPRD